MHTRKRKIKSTKNKGEKTGLEFAFETVYRCHFYTSALNKRV